MIISCDKQTNRTFLLYIDRGHIIMVLIISTIVFIIAIMVIIMVLIISAIVFIIANIAKIVIIMVISLSGQQRAPIRYGVCD